MQEKGNSLKISFAMSSILWFLETLLFVPRAAVAAERGAVLYRTSTAT